MSGKRKDKKGRVLRTGESQRKDLTYQYRYQDVTGKRRTVYAPTLEELRAKEDEINKAQDSGVDYNAGNVTVIELLENVGCQAVVHEAAEGWQRIQYHHQCSRRCETRFPDGL